MRRWIALLFILIVAGVDPAAAGEIAISVVDDGGNGVANAVVVVWPEDARPPAQAPRSFVIDQINEAFVPFVTVLRRGDSITFKNSDRTRHHVYSFAAIKQFQMVLNPGESSQPIKFDQLGTAAI